MKLSFLNCGWLEFSWEEMTATAMEMGFSGVQCRQLKLILPHLRTKNL